MFVTSRDSEIKTFLTLNTSSGAEIKCHFKLVSLGVVKKARLVFVFVFVFFFKFLKISLLRDILHIV